MPLCKGFPANLGSQAPVEATVHFSLLNPQEEPVAALFAGLWGQLLRRWGLLWPYGGHPVPYHAHGPESPTERLECSLSNCGAARGLALRAAVL